MYHRHSTSSNGGGSSSQHNQQPYPFQRSRSVSAKPQSQLKKNHESNSYQLASETIDTSFSSYPDTDNNYYGNKDNSNADWLGVYENKYNKRSNNIGSMSLQSFLFWRIFPVLLLIILPWIPNQFTRYEVRSKRLALEFVVQEQKDLVERLDRTTEKIKELKQEVENLHRDNELSYQELKLNGKTPKNLAADDKDIQGETSITDMESEEYAKLEEEEEVLVNRIDRLEKSIQKSAVTRLTEKYVFIFL